MAKFYVERTYHYKLKVWCLEYLYQMGITPFPYQAPLFRCTGGVSKRHEVSFNRKVRGSALFKTIIYNSIPCCKF